jgi:ribosome-associated translation inhibitor RaiA
MNLTISGHQLDVTDALRGYARTKVGRLVEPFEKQYGIKVNVWRARSEAILQRVVNEARGNKPQVDVVQSISPPMEYST